MASIFCIIAFGVINSLKEDDLFADTNFAPILDFSWQLLLFGLLGVICGVCLLQLQGLVSTQF